MAFGLGGRSSSSGDVVAEVSMVAAALVFVVGVILTMHFVASASQPSFQRVVRMVDVDSGTEYTGLLANSLIGNCVVMMCTGAFGCVGIQLERKGLVSLYFILTTVLLVYYLWALAAGLVLDTAIGPVLARQEQEFCNGTVHDVYHAALGCKGHAQEGADEVSCGPECLMRLEMLRRMGGCGFLEDLCESFLYKEMGVGACLVVGPPPAREPVLGPSVVGSGPPGQLQGFMRCCESACVGAERCAGYFYEEHDAGPRCHLVASAPPTPHRGRCSGYTWRTEPYNGTVPSIAGGTFTIVKADGQPGMGCFQKELTTQFMENIAITSVWLSVGSLVAIAILLAATASACLLQYSLTTKRQGKKGAVALMGKMLCPCSQGRARVNRVKGVQLERFRYDDSDDSDAAQSFVE